MFSDFFYPAMHVLDSSGGYRHNQQAIQTRKQKLLDNNVMIFLNRGQVNVVCDDELKCTRNDILFLCLPDFHELQNEG